MSQWHGFTGPFCANHLGTINAPRGSLRDLTLRLLSRGSPRSVVCRAAGRKVVLLLERQSSDFRASFGVSGGLWRDLWGFLGGEEEMLWPGWVAALPFCGGCGCSNMYLG